MKLQRSTNLRSSWTTVLLIVLAWACLLQNISALVASPSIPLPPAISMPVWSLAARHVDNDNTPETSMNIVTFCTPVSVAPPKLWAVSLYMNTMTRDAFLDSSKVGVLQLLTPDMKHVVPLLGKRSGREEGYSKQEACQEIGFDWVDSSNSSSCESAEKGGKQSNKRLLSGEKEESFHLLPGCASYIKLKVLSITDAGDHEVALCEVIATGRWDGEHVVEVMVDGDAGPTVASNPLDQSTVLYTGQLRDEGIL